MKICVTSKGRTMDSPVDPRFGRCAFFIIVDTDTLEFEAVDNAQVEAAGGAGVQSGQLMAEKKVRAVLTGNTGPNAYQTLQAAGIEVVTGISGTVQKAVDDYKAGRFSASKGPTVESHAGMKGGD